MNAKLTAKETALMTAIADNHFSFFDQGLVAGSGIWFEVMGQEIAGSTKYDVSATPRGVATVASSLGRKGLLEIEAQTGSIQNSEGAWLALSEAGAAWCEEFNAVDNTTTAAVLVEAREEREETPVAAVAPATFAKGDIVNDKEGNQWAVRRVNTNGSIRLVSAAGVKVNRKAEHLTKA